MLLLYTTDELVRRAFDRALHVHGVAPSHVVQCVSLGQVLTHLPNTSLAVVDFQDCRGQGDRFEAVFRVAAQSGTRMLLLMTHMVQSEDLWTAMLGSQSQVEMVLRLRAHDPVFWHTQLVLTDVTQLTAGLVARWQQAFATAAPVITTTYSTALGCAALSDGVDSLAKRMSHTYQVDIAPTTKGLRQLLKRIHGPGPHDVLVLCRLLLSSRMHDAGWSAERASRSLSMADGHRWRRTLMQCTTHGVREWSAISTDELLIRSAHLLGFADCNIDFFSRLFELPQGAEVESLDLT